MQVWLAAVIVVVVLAVIAAGLALTMPGPAVRGMLLLLAIPAYPGALTAIELGHGGTGAMLPALVILPTMLLACLPVAAAWRSRCAGVP